MAPVSAYDAIADLYDAWSRSVTEDVGFYVGEALAAGGPVVELGVGTGRIAIPTALAAVPVIGIDSSPAMLAVCRGRAEAAGVDALLDLREGDIRHPPVEGHFALVTAPFRSLLHLQSNDERRATLTAALALLREGGRFVFDVFTPGADDIAETHARWLEREPGIWERAEWDEENRILTLAVRGDTGETCMQLAWLPPHDWRELLVGAGFEVVACYGWFDRRPYAGGEDTVWVARARS